ncbi:hypothetical protein [Amycolatopsis anabasis]|uniref:hypothetical protein n=1 Tax=Amycolatopsis anabasis TaxID=1840409 RepID=UPI00131DA7F4|nr:hypothetical protein [Amycolatopsis anabasis]
MVERWPRTGVVSVGVLAGFVAGLSVAAALVAGRTPPQNAVPAREVVAPNPSTIVRTVPGPPRPASTITEVVVAPSPSELTIIERQTVTRSETVTPTSATPSSTSAEPTSSSTGQSPSTRCRPRC